MISSFQDTNMVLSKDDMRNLTREQYYTYRAQYRALAAAATKVAQIRGKAAKTAWDAMYYCVFINNYWTELEPTYRLFQKRPITTRTSIRCNLKYLPNSWPKTGRN